MLFDNELDIERYNPLLMVKDFNSYNLKTDNKLMTNADVPAIALEGVIKSPINPFTGKLITNEAKSKPLFVTASDNFDTKVNDGNVFNTSDAPWYKVTGDNIFDNRNWSKIESP